MNTGIVLRVNPLLGIDRTISFISPAVDGATKKDSRTAGGMYLLVLTLTHWNISIKFSCYRRKIVTKHVSNFIMDRGHRSLLRRLELYGLI